MKKIDERELRELFIELKSNNKIAFEKLYIKYNKLVYGIAFSILKNKEASEDVVQSVFSKLYEMDKSKMPDNKEASWLYTLTKNEAITFLRKKDNNIDLESIYNIEDKDNEINNIIDQVEFNRLIRGLNDKEKQIISLKILANLSFDEIGKLLGESTNTIKWRYYKSINTLKILLSNLGMFIITLAIGIKTLFKKKASNQEVIHDNKTEQNTVNIRDDTTKTENQETLTNQTKFNESQNENTNNEGTIIQEQTASEPTNYYGIGILSISLIFLIITIIIFLKYQLKLRKKSSKL